jgi:hypothetical protein
MRIFKMAAASALFFIVAAPAQAAVYDLNADWSTNANPNGPWTLREGSNALGAVPNWIGTGATAWAFGANPGGFLPGFEKAVINGPALGCSGCDWQAGDVIAHTTDAANGIGAGIANVRFLTPTAGTANVSGLTWSARQQSRPQQWALFLNGNLLGGDLLPQDGSNGRSAPDLFAFNNLALSAGDQIELRLSQAQGAPFGDFVGLNLRVDLTPSAAVPEPATWALMLFGFGLVGSAMRRRVKVRGVSFS